MNEQGKFTYNGKHCIIGYENKKFNLSIFKDETYMTIENTINLFPVGKFSENQKLIAFHVANMHILPNYFK